MAISNNVPVGHLLNIERIKPKSIKKIIYGGLIYSQTEKESEGWILWPLLHPCPISYQYGQPQTDARGQATLDNAGAGGQSPGAQSVCDGLGAVV